MRSLLGMGMSCGSIGSRASPSLSRMRCCSGTAPGDHIERIHSVTTSRPCASSPSLAICAG
jgi:hypothetical protein